MMISDATGACKAVDALLSSSLMTSSATIASFTLSKSGVKVADFRLIQLLLQVDSTQLGM